MLLTKADVISLDKPLKDDRMISSAYESGFLGNRFRINHVKTEYVFR